MPESSKRLSLLDYRENSRSGRSSMARSRASIVDPVLYYKTYDNAVDEDHLNIEKLIVGECFIGFSKLL